MGRRPTSIDGSLSDAEHYEWAARRQRERAAQATTRGLHGECIARAMLFEDKARECRNQAKGKRK